MPTSYASLTELKEGMNFPLSDTAKNSAMQLCLDAAAAVIDRVCNRPDGFVASAAAAREFYGTDKDYVYIGDCIAVTLVKSRSTVSEAWTDITSTWEAFAGDACEPVDRLPYTGVIRHSGTFPKYRHKSLQITAQWGYAATVPMQITQATIMQAARWFKRSESAWADAAANGELGALLYRKPMDPDIENILKNGRLVRPSI
jgi:hypothetical protein